jgi:ATP-dependent DNA helicase RecG
MAHLSDDVGSVRGIGPKKRSLLYGMGLKTLRDVLLDVPFRYDDWSLLPDVMAMTQMETAVFVGAVRHVEKVPVARRGLKVVKAVLEGDQGQLVCTWYNRWQIEKILQPGRRFLVYGRVNNRYGVELAVSDQVWIKDEAQLQKLLVLHPVYSLTEGLTKVDRLHLAQAALTCLDEIPQVLDEDQCGAFGIMDYRTSLYCLHQPQTMAQAQGAFKSQVVYEFLAMILWKRRQGLVVTPGIAHTAPPILADRFTASLPYSLTGAQKRAIEEIMRDMQSPWQMHRLLQGDVGSGKTNVAFYAMLAAVSCGHQAVLMAPTEVLARQHAEGAAHLFAPLGVDCALLTGRLTRRERDLVYAHIADGSAQCVFGTHALLEDGVVFRDLSLVVIDEQHRFGVKQREKLEAKGSHPDLLVTTATPIPRSLALTVYGDLKLTIIDELPANRKKVQTIWINSARLDAMYAFMRQEISQGRQAFIVCPLVEESEKVDLENAVALSQQLQDRFEGQITVGLLHGRMSGEEKEAVLSAYRQGKVQVLVSTTVIEVGIDVPNATVMVIMNAERFGLAQLHQLRGRVGRGSSKSYCILVCDSTAQEAQDRMKLLATSSDGFAIANADLKQRGPGELLGIRQHGQGLFHLARPGYDEEELVLADTIADALLQQPLSSGAQMLVRSIEARMTP